MRALVKPGDVTLIVVLLLASVGGMVYLRNTLSAGTYCIVYADGAEVGRYSLSRERVMRIRGPLGETTIAVERGAVSVIDSPCPHKVCMSMGRISRVGETVACIPNRVLVTVQGRREGGVDAVTR